MISFQTKPAIIHHSQFQRLCDEKFLSHNEILIHVIMILRSHEKALMYNFKNYITFLISLRNMGNLS